MLGLIVAAVLLAPWKLKFSVDAALLCDELYEDAAAEAEAGTLGGSRERATCISRCAKRNAPRVAVMARISGPPGVLMVVETLAWLAGLGVR